MRPEIVYQNQGRQITVRLETDEITIGRAGENDIVLDDNSVSRRHARIYLDGDDWRVADLGSKNGTRVNDLPDTDRVLQNGDAIHVNERILTFVDPTAAPDPPPGATGELPSVLADDPATASMQTVVRSTVDFSALATGGPETIRGESQESDRLRRLVGIVTRASEVIVTGQSLDETLRKMLDLVFEYMPLERGFVMLWDEGAQELVTRAVKHRIARVGPDAEIRFSRTIAEKVFREKVAVLTLDAQIDERFAAGESIAAMGIRSAMAAPLWNADRVDGLIGVDTSEQTRAFDGFDLDLLSALGNHLAVAVEQARLQQFAMEKERLDRELAVARDIQMGFLPRTMPAFGGYDVAGLSRPADETGGDTFDVIPVDERQLMLLLGDATGHGIGPALSATQVRSMLRIALRLGADLDNAFSHINDQLVQDLAANRFVTAFFGVVDNQAHRVRYHAGGQGPLLHFHAADSRCEWRGSSTLPMGMFPGVTLPQAPTMELAPGDLLGLITDGVFECENEAGEMFGEAGVERVIRAHHDRSMEGTVQRLLAAVDEFAGSVPQADDITIVLLRRLADPD